jgi:hypothetical protein
LLDDQAFLIMSIVMITRTLAITGVDCLAEQSY